MVPKNTICLWYDGTALDAAKFYAETFPNSAVGTVHRAPGDYPAGKLGDVLTVEFTVIGIPCLGLNGGPARLTIKSARTLPMRCTTKPWQCLRVRVSRRSLDGAETPPARWWR